MTKREERELFFKLVFMSEFQSDKELYDLVNDFLTTEGLEDKVDAFFSRMEKLSNHLSEIDDIINSLAEGWKTSRIAKVDLALLRVAIYEMQYETLEKGIAINEAVELAKQYGEDRSYAFINGILAKVGG